MERHSRQPFAVSGNAIPTTLSRKLGGGCDHQYRLRWLAVCLSVQVSGSLTLHADTAYFYSKDCSRCACAVAQPSCNDRAGTLTTLEKVDEPHSAPQTLCAGGCGVKSQVPQTYQPQSTEKFVPHLRLATRLQVMYQKCWSAQPLSWLAQGVLIALLVSHGLRVWLVNTMTAFTASYVLLQSAKADRDGAAKERSAYLHRHVCWLHQAPPNLECCSMGPWCMVGSCSRMTDLLLIKDQVICYTVISAYPLPSCHTVDKTIASSAMYATHGLKPWRETVTWGKHTHDLLTVCSYSVCRLPYQVVMQIV